MSLCLKALACWPAWASARPPTSYQTSVVELADTEALSRGSHSCPQHLFAQMLAMVTQRLAAFDAQHPG